MKKVFIIIGLFLCTSLLHAQTASNLANSEAIAETQDVGGDFVEYPSDALEASMNQSLSKEGKTLGVINSDGSVYVIGKATTARPSNMPGFIRSRAAAYHIAEMEAKMRLLQMAGEQITSGRGYQLLQDIIEGEDPDASESAQKVQNQLAKNEISRQDFKQNISSLVTAMLQGCAVVRIAEGEMGKDDYQIAVCVKYSPEFQSMASLMKRGGLGRVPTGASKDSRSKIMNMALKDLVYKMGAWVSFDQNGNMVVYGYGQEEVRATNSRASAAISAAQSKARLYAVNSIKNFVAEDLICKEILDDVEKFREYSDGSSAYYSRSKFQQAVDSRATTLNIATENVRTWRTTHPVSGVTVVGSVVCWTYENAAKARALRQQIDKGNVINGPSGTSVRQQTTKGKIIITGDDDDV